MEKKEKEGEEGKKRKKEGGFFLVIFRPLDRRKAEINTRHIRFL